MPTVSTGRLAVEEGFPYFINATVDRIVICFYLSVTTGSDP